MLELSCETLRASRKAGTKPMAAHRCMCQRTGSESIHTGLIHRCEACSYHRPGNCSPLSLVVQDLHRWKNVLVVRAVHHIVLLAVHHVVRRARKMSLPGTMKPILPILQSSSGLAASHRGKRSLPRTTKPILQVLLPRNSACCYRGQSSTESPK